MPYKLVVTKNSPNEEVSAVPEGWVVGTYLYWPLSRKKVEIESLRSNENSKPDQSWLKMKCRLKLSDICSYEEALRLEDLYPFQDTEDKEIYQEPQNKKKQTDNTLSKQLLDVNSEFDVDENNTTQNVISFEEVMVKKPYINIIKNVQGTSTSTSNDGILKIKKSELVKIIQENNALKTENKALKEELSQHKQMKNLQTKLDIIIDLLQNNNQASSIVANDGLRTGKDNDKIILGSLMFPIETKEQLDALENKLLDKDVMTYLVKKFSETCGTSGIARISKIGLNLMKNIIKDELLNQFAWKGIKRSTKTAFIQYVNIRELFYKVAHLADKLCSFRDSDSFIQNSAIKHSGQRLKRQMLSSEGRMNMKRMKQEINIMIPDTENMIDNTITEENDEESTDDVNDNDTNEEDSYFETNH